MIPVLLLFAAMCAGLLPIRYAVAGLPAFSVLERLALKGEASLLTAGPVHVQLVDVVLLILLARFVFVLAMEKRLALHGPLYLAIGLYLGVNLLATLVAVAKFGDATLLGSVTPWARLVSDVLVVPIMAQAVRTLPQARRCVWILVGTLAVLAVIQFVNFFGASRGIVIGEVQGLERGEERYFGPVGDSVGVVLLLGYLVALCFANVVGVLTFLGGILLTAGIGAIFSAGVGTGLFLVFGTRTDPVRRFVRRSYWLLPVFLFAAILALVGSPFARTFLERLETGNYKESSGQRMASVTMAGAMIANNPLLGVGYMGYERALPRYGGGNYFDLDHPDGGTANANNQLLQAFTDGGLLGFAAFVALMFVAARLLRRVATHGEDPLVRAFHLAAFLWLLTMIFGNLAAVWLVPSAFTGRLLWIVLGLAVAADRLTAPVSDPLPVAPVRVAAPRGQPVSA